jgi:hypothetical protein
MLDFDAGDAQFVTRQVQGQFIRAHIGGEDDAGIRLEESLSKQVTKGKQVGCRADDPALIQLGVDMVAAFEEVEGVRIVGEFGGSYGIWAESAQKSDEVETGLDQVTSAGSRKTVGLAVGELPGQRGPPQG